MMTGPAARRYVVTELQAMSAAARLLIAIWKPDGGFNPSVGPARSKPEVYRQRWDQVATTALAIAERALRLAEFAVERRDALPGDQPTVDPRTPR